MTFGFDSLLELGIGMGDWDRGGIGDLDWELGLGIWIWDWDWDWGLVLTFGLDFWLGFSVVPLCCEFWL